MKPPGTNAGSRSISPLGEWLADRRPKMPCLGLIHASTVQNSNREGIRLETAATQTKQRIGTCSNREKEAVFFGPSREGCFSPPAFRPRFSRRQRPAKTHIHRAASDQNSNREGIRLETAVTQAKQRIGTCSNREKEACFSTSKLRRAPKLGSRGGDGNTHGHDGRVVNPLPYVQQPLRREKNRNRLPPKVLRLKRRPTVCFV